MFRTWLKENRIEDHDLSGALLPPASDRAYWDTCYREGYIRTAEKYLDFDWPVIKATDFMAYKLTGNRQPNEQRTSARRSALTALLLGEVVEYKGRFLPDIVNGLLATCEETFWGTLSEIPALRSFAPAAHPQDPPPCFPDADYNFIGLTVGDTASLLAFTYHLLYSELQEYCPEILRRIEYEMERRIITPYLHHHDFWWMGYPGYRVNNWNPWVIANILSVTLLVEKRRSAQNACINKMLYEIQYVFDTYPDDGGCEEGSTYWYASVGMLFEFCEQLFRATRGSIDFLHNEKLIRLFRYPILNYLGNGHTLSFADGGDTYSFGYPAVFYRCGKILGNEQYVSFAKDLCAAYLADPQLTPSPSVTLVRNTLFFMHDLNSLFSAPDYIPENGAVLLEQLQQSFIHTGDWFYALKGGSNGEQHSHNAVGSFILTHRGRPVLIDSGSGTYSAKLFGPERYDIWFTQSAWHNLPIVNGCTEKNGTAYAADSMQLDGNAATVSFAGAYPAEAGLQSLVRTVCADGTFTVKDRLVFTGAKNRICEHFLTHLDVECRDNAFILGGLYRMQCSTAATLSVDEIHFEDDAGMLSRWPQGRLNRLAFQFDADSTAVICITLCPID